MDLEFGYFVFFCVGVQGRRGQTVSTQERFMSLVRDAFISVEDLDQKNFILRATQPYCYCQTLAV